MEAIGEQLDGPFGGLYGGLLGGNADDAGSRRTSPARLRAVPGGEGSGPAILGALAEELATAALAAPGVLATATYIEAADYAARVENLARTVEYLQLISALTVDRTRTQAITQAAARTTHPAVPSPADDGCRNTAEFLRLRLRIPIREARRRLTLAQHTLPRTSLTGEPLPPTRPHLATALTPHPATDGTTPQPPTGTTLQAPAVSSHAATLITATLDRLQHHTTPHTLDRIEKHLTTAATTTDPDFLTRLAQRWTDTIDADGTEPTEEALRHTQGAFIRKPRHGLHHLEIFATTDQYEHLLTVMNTATNPRTTTPNTSTGTTTPTTGTEHHGRTAETAAVPDLPAQPALPDLDRRTRAQKQLDGIITAAKTALATNTLPTTGGNKPQIIATIHYRDLFPTHTTATATGERPGIPAPPGTQTGTGTEAGTGAFAFTGPVAATTLRKIACDADIIPALLGTNNEILDLGRKTRLFTPAQRTALTTRDQGCAFPNCTIPAPWCEAHHITYWTHGGPTTTNNGVLLCSHHHHLIHKEQWTITTTNHTPTFIPPPHIDPTQKPQQNHYFKPPPPPHQYE